MRRTITKTQIKQAAQAAYEESKTVSGGENAHYIPYLANVDSRLFGLSVTLADGTCFNYGDTDYRFGIESVSKVPTAILAMIQHTPEGVLQQIGADATGLPFNSIFAILLENDHPSTPLVNAGAIAACSMITPQGDAADKWKAITDNITNLCGSAPELIDELYESETATNFNNRAISWLLKNYNRIYDDVDMSLDLYTRLEPRDWQAGFRPRDFPQDNRDDCRRRLLSAYRRLAIYLWHTGQDRCRWRRDGRDARALRHCGLCATS